jgi:hypothetical protein
MAVFGLDHQPCRPFDGDMASVFVSHQQKWDQRCWSRFELGALVLAQSPAAMPNMPAARVVNQVVMMTVNMMLFPLVFE